MNAQERKASLLPRPYFIYLQQTHLLHLGTSRNDIRCGLVLEPLEVLEEEHAELVNLLLEVRFANPALGGVEQIVGHVGDLLWHVKVEGLVSFVLRIGELATVNSVEDGASVLPVDSVLAY